MKLVRYNHPKSKFNLANLVNYTNLAICFRVRAQ